MGIGDSITLMGCLAGMVLALPALLIFLNMVFYSRNQRAARRLQRGGIIPFFAGLVPLVMMGFFGSIFLSAGSVLQFFGFIIWLFLLLWGFTGLSIVARVIGERLGTVANRPENPLLEIGIGAVVLTFAIAFPLIGWFLILPLGIFIGTGAYNLALIGGIFGRSKPDLQPRQPAAYEASEATL